MHPSRTHSVLSAFLLTTWLAAAQSSSQQPWQHLQMPTRTQVAATWGTPPSEYGPEPYFDLSGQLDLPEIQRDLDHIKVLGFRAITPQAGLNMPFAYLSPAYFKFFQTLVAEAKKRDLRIWIVDDIGYPSGFAGGRFTREHPELRMQTLGVAKTYTLTTGQILSQPITADIVAVTAISTAGQSISLPFADNKISWQAPEGTWQIIVVEHRFETSPTRSDLNPKLATEPRPNTNIVQAKDRSASLEDYLNPAATAQFITYTHEQYKKYVGEEFGKTIIGFRGDEPDYSVSGLPWTQAFFDSFQSIKGYDIHPYLAAFLLNKDLTPAQLRARADYWDIFSQLFAQNFFKVQSDWCARNHLEYQVHIDFEERQLRCVHTDGDFFRDMRSVQVPGIDMTRHQIWTDTISDYPRLASSVAHVYGRPRAFTESFASARPMPDSATTRYILNEQIVRGVNLAELMYFPTSGSGARPATPLMQRPEFPALMTYVSRLSYLMSMGRPTATVALYLPTSSLWMDDTAADTAFVSTERFFSEHQIDFDIVNEDALAHDLTLDGGFLKTLSGNVYHTVISPDASALSQSALDRLHTFAEAGGNVLFLTHPPSLIFNRTILDARTSTPADFIWATIIPGELPTTPTPSDDPPATPPIPQIVPLHIQQALTAISPTITLDQPDPALRVMQRRWQDADLYLLFNEGPNPTTHTITLNTSGQTVELWNPQTATITPLQECVVSTEAQRSGETCFSSNALHILLTLQPFATQVLIAH